MIDEQRKQKEHALFMRKKMLEEMTEGNLRRMNRIKNCARLCCCCCRKSPSRKTIQPLPEIEVGAPQ